ncbi:MAG: ABC transporter ATP-binding protein [Thiohalocapsa sp.]
MAELLQVRSLERRFGTKQALRGLDFSLAPGEVLGLLGANGAGKTTCLRILSGDLAPSRGSVRISGFDLARNPVAARRHIGYLPERPPLYPDMRVDEYLQFCARLRRIPPGSIPRVVRRVKQRCGLEQTGQRLLGKLSKGYRQRAGLAQALIHEPDLVILDEPTDGLDPVQIREVRGLIGDLAPSCGVVVSSHALSEVQSICNRVIILRDGGVLYDALLTSNQDKPALLVRLRHAPKLSQLNALDPIADATPMDEAADGGRTTAPTGFRIRLADHAGSEQLSEALVSAGWGLLEMTTEGTDLERVFFRCLGAQGPS